MGCPLYYFFAFFCAERQVFMAHSEVAGSEQSLIARSASAQRSVEVLGAFPVRLQRLDVARHIAVTPDGKRYVVASFDDTRLGNGYITAIYPQQNGYLTLMRLVVCEIYSKTPEEAVQKHVHCIQAIQQGKVSALVQSLHK